MTDERLREAFAHIGPSNEAKRRMLANILAAVEQQADAAEDAGSSEMDALDGNVRASAGSHPADAARVAAAPHPKRRFRAWHAAGIGAAACLVLIAGAGILSLSQNGAPDASSLKSASSAPSAQSEEITSFDASSPDISANSAEHGMTLPLSFEFRERIYIATFEVIETSGVGEFIGEAEVAAASDGASKTLSVYALSSSDSGDVDAIAVTSLGSAEFYRYESVRDSGENARS